MSAPRRTPRTAPVVPAGGRDRFVPGRFGLYSDLLTQLGVNQSDVVALPIPGYLACHRADHGVRPKGPVSLPRAVRRARERAARRR